MLISILKPLSTFIYNLFLVPPPPFVISIGAKNMEENELNYIYSARFHTEMGELHVDLCMQTQPPHPEKKFKSFDKGKKREEAERDRKVVCANLNKFFCLMQG